ncbi:hypothetical protein CMV_025141 [Castanea mollissima]|uniref:Uncharacterized protein n=1 Tax=Castanea mollissima TaxID=60419 RepID=A0A8J4QMH7_9ROSI|nr:hypothetical protein CMV_025141 [Castanea mollissima]
MNLNSKAKEFFSMIRAYVVLVLSKLDPRLPTPPTDKDVELGEQEHEHRKMNWTNGMVAFCFALAVGIALLPIQVHIQLQTSLICLSLTVLLGFACFFVSAFIDPKFLVTVRVLQRLGRFFTVTAFFVAITFRFPLYFQCMGWAVYFICFLSIFISSFF